MAKIVDILWSIYVFQVCMLIEYINFHFNTNIFHGVKGNFLENVIKKNLNICHAKKRKKIASNIIYLRYHFILKLY